MNDENLDDWLLSFGNAASCPVCNYRWGFTIGDQTHACRIKGFEPCLAITNGVLCERQYWFKVVNDGGSLNFAKIRRNLARRLEYWHKIYAEKYPVMK